ncbi:MFS transporter [Pseudonocardia acaciae]|uniref:MFS transporter n=1 Tax=Pseudonocardia acaciae TaxID=551276 RepID=UPI00055EF481|nr:MFS transporter [Pseudonocardia acaciae]
MSKPEQASRGLGSDVSTLSARLDRIEEWSLTRLFFVIIGLGMLFVQYDVFDINVSFIQTCVDIKPGCTPLNALGSINIPILVSLIGYGIGALTIAPLADWFGRRQILMFTMALTGAGSLYSALSGDFTNFSVSRLVTGLGIGADLAVMNTYVNEVAPRRTRARFTSILFLLAAVGGALAVWLGLILTTQPAPWPDGLPFALASGPSGPQWRWMYVLGALLALASVLLRAKLPESPRWLLVTGRTAEAETVIRDMERRAERRGPLPAPATDAPAPTLAGPGAYRELFGDPVYLRRCLILGGAWMAGYVTLYAFGAGFTSVLTAFGYSPPAAGMVSAVGLLGFVASAVVAVWYSEALERKYWLPVGAAVAVVGAVLVALAGGSPALVFLGAVISFFGQNVWVAPQYALTAESFPTRCRTTGYAVSDSIGHVGGGIGVFVVAGFAASLAPLPALLLLVGFLVVAAIVNLFAASTRNRRLEEVSR